MGSGKWIITAPPRSDGITVENIAITLIDRAVLGEQTAQASDIAIRPKQRVSMLAVKFPKVFNHSVGGVSEINVICDIYKESSGLQYWLRAEDSPTGRKGDLLEIIYGPSRRTQQQVVGSGTVLILRQQILIK